MKGEQDQAMLPVLCYSAYAHAAPVVNAVTGKTFLHL